jgi:hypothetical protein
MFHDKDKLVEDFENLRELIVKIDEKVNEHPDSCYKCEKAEND